MEKRIGFVFLVLLFAVVTMQAVSATDTDITVYTYAAHSVTVNVLDPSSGDAIQTFQKAAGDDGVVTIQFGSGTRSIDVGIIIRDRDGKIVRKHTYTGYTTGSPLSFDLKIDPDAPVVTPPPVVAPVVNNTPPAVNITNVTVSDDSNVSGGNETSSSWTMPRLSINWKYVYYTIGVIVAIIIIFFLIKFLPKIISKMPRAPAGPVVGKSTAEKYYYNTKTEKQLADAERKIREAQMEIDRIRNKKKIVSDAERRFEEAKRELERLKDY